VKKAEAATENPGSSARRSVRNTHRARTIVLGHDEAGLDQGRDGLPRMSVQISKQNPSNPVLGCTVPSGGVGRLDDFSANEFLFDLVAVWVELVRPG
jgi:hypothetical protein